MHQLDELWDIVRSIPPGKTASYGEVGRALRYPASGFLIGKWMAQCPENVPWWRVVSKDGQLPLGKRSPSLGEEQIQRLKAEGTRIEEGRVSPADMMLLLPSTTLE